MDFLLLVVVPVIAEKRNGHQEFLPHSHPFRNVLKRLNFQLTQHACISHAMKLVEKWHMSLFHVSVK